MRQHQTKASTPDANATLAYKFWKARCFRDGSPEEDLLRAVCANSMEIGVTKPNPRSRRPLLNHGKPD